MKTGDVVVLEDAEAVRMAKDLTDDIQSADVGFDRACRSLKRTQKALFSFLNGLYPELEEFNCRFNHEKHSIDVLGKKSD